jgi:uncharacterized membrane protein
MEKHLTLPILLHLAAALAAVAIGVAVLLRRKGTPSHRLLGRLWVGLMAAAALSSFWIFEIRQGAGLSWIHGLSAWTLLSLGCAVYFIRRGNVRAHKGFMVGTFLGLVGAGVAALLPGRFLMQWIA